MWAAAGQRPGAATAAWCCGPVCPVTLLPLEPRLGAGWAGRSAPGKHTSVTIPAGARVGPDGRSAPLGVRLSPALIVEGAVPGSPADAAGVSACAGLLLRRVAGAPVADRAGVGAALQHIVPPAGVELSFARPADGPLAEGDGAGGGPGAAVRLPAFPCRWGCGECYASPEAEDTAWVVWHREECAAAAEHSAAGAAAAAAAAVPDEPGRRAAALRVLRDGEWRADGGDGGTADFALHVRVVARAAAAARQVRQAVMDEGGGGDGEEEWRSALAPLLSLCGCALDELYTAHGAGASRPVLPPGAVAGVVARLADTLRDAHGAAAPPRRVVAALFSRVCRNALHIRGGACVLLLCAMANHDCEPSAEVCVDDSGNGAAALVSLRPLQSGEEVTLAYMPYPSDAAGRAAVSADREEMHRAALRWQWGFTCRCARCGGS